MLALRPTFSESWYRVQGLRARLRPSAQISRQFYRGERWYVVRDPAGNQYHRLSDPAYRFVALLDGRRSVQEAWDLAGGQLADDAPTQPEVIQILSQLYAANLIEADITPDSGVLLRRHKNLLKRKMQGRLMNMLFPRIPLWDCDQFLQRWMPVVGPTMSKFGALVWLAVVIGAIVALAPHWDELQRSASNAINPGNWLMLWAVFVFTKLIHELGHAFSCRRFGGEVHELGVMFLVLIPTPYVDASSAWGFPSRWQRMFVGAAGMVVEIFFAALCAFAWLQVGNKDSEVAMLLYNAMLVASVSTVLFNANPLLRYDGYYMLSDWWEIPNLQKKSSEYTLGIVKRHIFRVKDRFPLPPLVQRLYLFAYANLSTVYRIFVGVMIILLVLYQLPEQMKFVGILLGAASLVTWFGMPLFKLTKYLMLSPELHRKRGRAVAFSLAMAGLIFALVGVMPMWNRVYATGIVEADQKAVLHAGMFGFVSEVHTHNGQLVAKDAVLLQLENPDLDAHIAQLESRIKATEISRSRSIVMDPVQKTVDEAQLRLLTEQQKDARQKKADLTIRSPIAGRVVAPEMHELIGRFVQRGQEVCTVVKLDQLVVKATLDQEEIELVERDLRQNKTPETEVRLSSLPLRVLIGIPTVYHSADAHLPHESLTHHGGEAIVPDTQDPEGKTAAVPQFPLRVLLENPNEEFLPGQRAYVRLDLTPRTIYEIARDKLFQVIMRSTSQGG